MPGEKYGNVHHFDWGYSDKHKNTRNQEKQAHIKNLYRLKIKEKIQLCYLHQIQHVCIYYSPRTMKL